MATVSCKGKADNAQASAADSTAHPMPDTLRVATLYSPRSYFIYRDEPMGYDYSLLSDFAEAQHVRLDLEVATSLKSAIAMLDSGKVDLVAYEVPMTSTYSDKVLYCGPTSLTEQVLVQPGGAEPITDVTQLIGKDVYVQGGGKYQQRIEHLNNELGGGINIHLIDRDTMIIDDVLAMVAEGQIPLTVVDSDVAQLNKTYYPNLNITLPLSFKQRASWAVRKDEKWLADSINAFFGSDAERQQVAQTYRRYFELSKAMPSALTYQFNGGVISPYDNLFRKHAADIDWDWRLMAAQGFVESRFKNNAVSWAGARGLMQIMPQTSRYYGVNPKKLNDPAVSIQTASKVIATLDKMFTKYVDDPEERRLFVVAAYNSGAAHILDAIALARKHGLNPQKWKGNVEKALLMKSQRRYFNDPVVKYGYFRGRETVNYVDQVATFYDRTKKHVPMS